MSTLDNLIDLLERVKETDPEFSKKAASALDLLLDDDDVEEEYEHCNPEEEIEYYEYEDDEEEEVSIMAPPAPPPLPRRAKKQKKKKKKNKKAPAPTTPKEYPQEVEISDKHLKDTVKARQEISHIIAKLGLIQQNYEVDKELALEEIEKKQKAFERWVEHLQLVYGLDPESTYVMKFPENDSEKASFVKQ